jgi:hypothetical protein
MFGPAQNGDKIHVGMRCNYYLISDRSAAFKRVKAWRTRGEGKHQCEISPALPDLKSLALMRMPV